MTSLLQVKDLQVSHGGTLLVGPVSFELCPGEPLTLLGQTGAGKSLLIQAIMGLLPEGLESRGKVLLAGRSLLEMTVSEREQLWGVQMGMLPQEPWHALAPLKRVGRQVSEVYSLVLKQRPAEAQANSEAALARVGMPRAAQRYPWQLSGGMAQRVTFCAATAAGGKVLLVDEPTKGLDAAQRNSVCDLLGSQCRTGALLTVTHDVEVAARLGGRVMIMRRGRIVEQGSAERVLTQATEPYTRELIASVPGNWSGHSLREVSEAAPVVLEARGLSKERGGQLLFRDLNLSLRRGDIVGLTGDSGVGKSSLGDILLGLLEPDSGSVKRMPGLPAHRFQRLLQNPLAAFASHLPLIVLFRDLMKLHGIAETRLTALLETLELSPALLQRSALALSGGELQRAALARIMLLEPVFLFADEPVSRLDPITARKVIEMLVRVVEQQQCTLLLVSHDPALVRQVCHRTLHLSAPISTQAQTV